MDGGAETAVQWCSWRYWTWRNSANGKLCSFNNLAWWV